ncbi:MAG: hypothetical protein RMJ84_04430 [Sandaracinaceae bacterium]|nr:hypothetical protein [Sandaracinaceae bacterium]
MREHEPSYRRWAGGFLSLHLAMVGVQLSLALSADNEGAAAEAWIGTISSALGLITLLISWPALVGSLETIEKHQAQEARAQHELMRELESRIERQLSQGSFVRSPIPPLLNTLYLTTASSILLFGWGRIGGALLLAIGGSIIANARLILYPSGLEAAWHGYANRHLKACPFH